MKRVTLSFILMTIAACGSSGKNQSESFDALPVSTTASQTQNNQQPDPQQPGEPQTTVAADNNAATTTVTGNTNAPATVDSNTAATNTNTVVAHDDNPNHLNVNPNTGLLDYRYGAFSLTSANLSSHNYDGCFILAGTDSADPNHAGYWQDRSFSYDANTMIIENGALTSVKLDQGIYNMTMTLYPDRTGFVQWERPSTAQQPGCYTVLETVSVYPLPAVLN